MANVKMIDAGNSCYMSDFMDDLPENVSLNKVSTGCGGTTVALRSKSPYVIAVPFRSLIWNKVAWAKKNGIILLPVLHGVTNSEIRQFKGNKIMTTYDSLGRVTDVLDGKVKSYKLLIDESHKLVDSGAFRGNAIRTVLENFRKYRAFTFMTATPIPDKYQLNALVDIPKAKINWKKISPIHIKYLEVDRDISKMIVGMILNVYENKQENKNVHFFLNSVKSIVEVTELLKAYKSDIASDVNIVCSTSNPYNERYISSTLGNQFKIKQVGEVNRINFYTSTAFEGSDIFDKEGVVFIGTDGFKDTTKVDILTTLPQIAGRIRDIKNKDLSLVYKPGQSILSLSENEYEAEVKAHITDAEEAVKAFEQLNRDADKEALIRGYSDSVYLLERNNQLIVNETAWKAQMAAYHTIHSTYYAGGFTAGTVTHNHVEYSYSPSSFTLKNPAILNLKLDKPANFKELCDTYRRALEVNDEDTISEIQELKPLVAEAFNVLGWAKIKAMRFVQKKIKQELIAKRSLTSLTQKIADILDLHTDDLLSGKEIKQKLGDVYSFLGIQKKPKIGDLAEWYSYKRKSLNNSNEKFSGYVIIFRKVISDS